jgi:hypothetical protein
MMSGPEVKHLWICSLSLGRRCQPARFENRPLERALFRDTSSGGKVARTNQTRLLSFCSVFDGDN